MIAAAMQTYNTSIGLVNFKSFYFTRLLNVFDGDNFRSFKLICPKCRRVNIFSVCTC